MLVVHSFTFNAFQENTYLLVDSDSLHCIIIDPGCSDVNEQRRLSTFINKEKLIPKRLINTHCHIDHILGNHFVAELYSLPLEAHEGEVPVLASGDQVSSTYGISYTTSPSITSFLQHGDTVTLGSSSLEIRLTPGHSPASICLIDHEQRQVLGGDVLFRGSIGRTDLPGGSFQTLIDSIQRQLFSLEDDYTIFPGHGPITSIGYEKLHNPFFQ